MSFHSTFQNIETIASDLGFDYCGIAKAGFLDEDARRLEKWLKQNMHGNMLYMENHFDLRTNPELLVPGAKTVITLLCNYYPQEFQEKETYQVSKYAYGNDYHEVIRERLKDFLLILRERFGDIQGRGFVDSAPVLERAWATKSGLGWIGKNGNLLTKKHGSFFFIATLITDLEIRPTEDLHKDYCGTCTKCIDHCPTEAILPGKIIDGSKCISYYTIELKEESIPHTYNNNWGDWIFGCDICQDVCPWNRFSIANNTPAFEPNKAVKSYSKKDWEELSEEHFKIIFKNSPIKRTKWQGIKRNINFIKKNHE